MIAIAIKIPESIPIFLDFACKGKSIDVGDFAKTLAYQVNDYYFYYKDIYIEDDDDTQVDEIYNEIQSWVINEVFAGDDEWHEKSSDEADFLLSNTIYDFRMIVEESKGFDKCEAKGDYLIIEKK